MIVSTAGRSKRAQQAPRANIRLMIVDDSPVARAVLSRMIAGHDGFEIAALAGTAAEALAALRSVEVDVVLLDLEMPGGNGLDALPQILRAGARVLIVSSLCEAGAEATVRALALGAADTLPKPGTGAFGGRFSQVLADKLRAIAGTRTETRPAPGTGGLQLRAMPDAPLGCVAIAASTGGLRATNDFLCALPPRIRAPILVTQHLPALFMPVFARQIEGACGRAATVAQDGEALVADRIYVAPGDAHLRLDVRLGAVAVRLCRIPAASGCLPSADPMLASVADVYGAAGVGVILSGMGRDGLAGAWRLVESGGAMLAQDRSSAAVWGMPRGVAEAGLASAVLAPAGLARRLAARIEPSRC